MEARCATPREYNGSYIFRTLSHASCMQYGEPVTQPARSGFHERAERPRRYVPDISGTDEALPRDISLSGEHEALPAPLFAALQKLTFP